MDIRVGQIAEETSPHHNLGYRHEHTFVGLLYSGGQFSDATSSRLSNQCGKESGLTYWHCGSAKADLSTRDFKGVVEGVKDLQRSCEEKYGPGNYEPNIPLDYWSFRLMVSFGFVAVVMTPVVLVYQGWTYWVFRKRVSASQIQHPERGILDTLSQ